jgi:predicted RNase H-like HicB family nuclease
LQQTILEAYAHEAARHAIIKQFDDGSYSVRVPSCSGVVVFGATAGEALSELEGVLQEWAKLGVQLGDTLPVFGDIDLNTEEARRLADYQ